MNIQVLSDLHLEFGNDLPTLAPDADVVVLAGDIAPYRLAVLREIAAAWIAPVLYVPGNHEYYEGDIDAVGSAMAERCAALGIELLDRRSVVLDGVRFIGATLWTDFALNGVADAFYAKRTAANAMPDFRVIACRGGVFTPDESVSRHDADRNFIEAELRTAAEAGETAVVVTHHAPTPRSIRPWYVGNSLNPAFASDLETLIARHAPPLWIHGHMHDSIDEQLGATRVLANPGGYSASENPPFDPHLCAAVEGGGVGLGQAGATAAGQ